MIEFVIAACAVISLLVILALIYLLVLVRPRAKTPTDTSLLCSYAHRGLHGNGVPENSLKAFRLAAEAGFGIELDVQLSRDGEVMVFHDYTLVRMTGVDKKLCELDADELCKLRLGDTEQTVPDFREVLSLIDGRVPVLVELKGESLDSSLCPKVAEILREYTGSYCIESFNPMLIKDIKKHLPDAYCGLLYTNVCRDKKKSSALNIALTCMALNFLCKPNFIAYNELDRHSLPVRLTTRLYRAPRFVWTTRGQESIDTALSLGEHPIFERQ